MLDTGLYGVRGKDGRKLYSDDELKDALARYRRALAGDLPSNGYRREDYALWIAQVLAELNARGIAVAL